MIHLLEMDVVTFIGKRK